MFGNSEAQEYQQAQQPQAPAVPGIMGQMGQGLYAPVHEKTFADKLMAKDTIARITELMQKTNISHDEFNELIHSSMTDELKLFNFGEDERYVAGKVQIWIQPFANICNELYYYEQSLKTNKMELSPESRKLLERSRKQMETYAKTMLNIYFFVGRSSLSMRAMLIGDLTKQKLEYYYGEMNNPILPQNREKKGFLSRLGIGK